MSQTAAAGSSNVARTRIQAFGRFLSGMVMPNIGAFIAWGLITAFFIPTGWLPNEGFATLVGPMITYLLPLLIAYTGGKAVHGVRGGVVGAVAAMGVIVGADIPMFIGAMIMGPLGGWLIKKLDEAIEGKIPAGFEMLVNNFSAGILGMILVLLAYKAIGPTVLALNNVLAAGVQWIVNAGLLPLANLFIEPGKILFLNNAINHGILGPLGVAQVQETGKSIFFLLETNPGPGLGLLLAYWLFGKGTVKQSAPGAIIIHFFGGIHEIYFPYVLMNPISVLAVMAGGVAGTFTFTITRAGLVATPSPGSIFAEMAMAPKGGLLPVLLGILVAAAVSFVVAIPLVKRHTRTATDEDLEEAKATTQALKGKGGVKKIVFACDAGMGSSAMGASVLRRKIQERGLNVAVVHSAVNEIPEDADIIITHKQLADRARQKAGNAQVIEVENFVNNPVYDEIVSNLK
ncbi:PTS system mannitol-specific IIC component [Symbiobacterium terraclitae]|uniref:PTS system mannitol-specific EIICB component n=1 Tax=Symbiobacterium terraclitae TaxID=557451 RepID=A0ABS4JM58_9FIRM|nr:PTS mannitol transporter subunit IICB [Symbiobacterium terraclitae]MBP2016632.1 PTS system mannitol-specific IIC component [Symbiobacterium terraclitae]